MEHLHTSTAEGALLRWFRHLLDSRVRRSWKNYSSRCGISFWICCLCRESSWGACWREAWVSSENRKLQWILCAPPPPPASSHHMLFILLYLLHFTNKERKALAVLHPYLNHSHLDLASQVFGWVTGDQGPGKHYKAWFARTYSFLSVTFLDYFLVFFFPIYFFCL